MNNISLYKEAMALAQKQADLHAKLEVVQARLNVIHSQLSGQTSGRVGGKIAKSIKGKSKGPRKAHGALTARLVEALEKAGQKGLRVAELSENLGIKVGSLYVWFHGALKRIPGLEKLAAGHYRLNSTSSGEVPVRKKAKSVKQRRKGGKGKANVTPVPGN